MRRRIRWRNLIIALGVILIAGAAVAIFFALLETSLPYEYQITESNNDAMGGYPVLVYDVNGNLCDYNLYTGKAPIYEVKDEHYSQLGITSELPKYISPTLLNQFSTIYYPVALTLDTPDPWLRQGESTAVTITMEILDDFTDRDGKISIEEAIKPLYFNLEAPNFEYEPQNRDILPKNLILQNPINQIWVIAPKERSLGKQVIYVTVKATEENEIAWERYDIKVRPFSGIDPYLAGFITVFIGTLGLIIGWMIKNMKDVLEIKRLLQKPKQG